MIKITVDTLDLADIQDEIHSSVIGALSRAASEAAFKVRAEMPRRFTIRNGYVTRGIRYSKATPGKPYAEVYSKDDFMAKQEDGGSFDKEGHRFAMPAGVRENERSIIPRRNRPKHILENARVFKADFKGKNHRYAPHAGIFMRINNNKNLKALYLLKDRRKYKPRWEFEKTVEETAMEKFRIRLALENKYGWMES